MTGSSSPVSQEEVLHIPCHLIPEAWHWTWDLLREKQMFCHWVTAILGCRLLVDVVSGCPAQKGNRDGVGDASLAILHFKHPASAASVCHFLPSWSLAGSSKSEQIEQNQNKEKNVSVQWHFLGQINLSITFCVYAHFLPWPSSAQSSVVVSHPATDPALFPRSHEVRLLLQAVFRPSPYLYCALIVCALGLWVQNMQLVCSRFVAVVS